MGFAHRMFQADSLNELVNGFTNVPLALYDKIITAAALEQMVGQLSGKGFLPDYDYDPYDHHYVVRVDADARTINFFHTNWFNSYWHHAFSCDAGTIISQKGQRFHGFDALASAFTLGIYALARNRLPSVQANAEQFAHIKELAEQSSAANLGDVRRITDSIAVYLGDDGAVRQQTGSDVRAVPLPGAQKYVEGSTERVIQVITYLLGGNAVIDYQRASPARGTPVILRK